MKAIALRASDRRFLDSLPAADRQIVVDILVELDAWITDGDRRSPIRCFLAEIDDPRYVTDDSREEEKA